MRKIDDGASADFAGRPWPAAEHDARRSAVLPDGVVVHPALAVSGQVALAGAGAAPHDWFDTLALPGGRVGVVMGDVAHRGATAASTVGRLRAALPLALTEDADPGTALERLARFAVTVPESVGTSIAVLVVEPDGDRVHLATAGYPAAVLVPMRGEPRTLGTSGGSLGLGVRYPVESVDLEPGDLVVLLSDAAADGAADGAAGAATDPYVRHVVELVTGVRLDGVDDLAVTERACHEVLHARAPAAGYADDAVAVAVRRRAWDPGTLAVTLPAIPDTVAVARHELADWLEGVGLGDLDVSSLLQAVSELVANAVEHAYPPGTDHRRTAVSLTAELGADGVVAIEVVDTGRWRAAGDSAPVDEAYGPRGRGLHLARAFVDALTVVSTEAGTSCGVRHRPLRPVTVLAARGGQPAGAAPAQDARFESPAGEGRLVVGGAVDLVAADRFRLLVGAGTRGGTRRLEVDLNAVTLLSSSAVAVLIEAGAGDPDGAIRLCAAAGTPAAGVLRRVGLTPR